MIPLFDHADGGDRRTSSAPMGARSWTTCVQARRSTCICRGRIAACWNREGLQGQPEVILCEALLDALTFWNAGYRNVTSCYGVNGLTEELVAALKACGAQRVLIAFDRDEAGDRGAEAVAAAAHG